MGLVSEFPTNFRLLKAFKSSLKFVSVQSHAQTYKYVFRSSVLSVMINKKRFFKWIKRCPFFLTSKVQTHHRFDE